MTEKSNEYDDGGVEAYEEYQRLIDRPQVIIQGESERFRSIMCNPIDQLGVVLRSHAAVELFLTHYMNVKSGLKNLNKLRLRHEQLIQLIDEDDEGLFALRPALRQLNSIRNKFAHEQFFEIDEENLEVCAEIIRVYDHEDPWRRILEIVQEMPLGTSEAEHVRIRNEYYQIHGMDYDLLQAGDPMERIKWLAFRVHWECLTRRYDETADYLRRENKARMERILAEDSKRRK